MGGIPGLTEILGPKTAWYRELRWDSSVIANAHATYRAVPGWMHDGQTLVDLVRLVEKSDVHHGEYVGLAW